jgi:hypothetical protein
VAVAVFILFAVQVNFLFLMFCLKLFLISRWVAFGKMRPGLKVG